MIFSHITINLKNRVSRLAYKKIRNCYFIFTSKKAEQTEKSTFHQSVRQVRSQSKPLPPKIGEAEDGHTELQLAVGETSMVTSFRVGKPEL